MAAILGMLFDGVAYGMLLFLMSVGLSVTLGMMNFVNLAHCSFAMLGGYVAVTLMNAWGWPFFTTLPVAFIAAAAASVVLERLFFRRFYNAGDLQQCLLTIGIVFVSIASAAYIYGTDQQPVHLPDYLLGSLHLMGIDFAVYRLFLIGTAMAITILLFVTLETTRYGAQVRAAVNNQRMARGLGINVDSLFAVTFALGSGLAGLGGALAINMLGLDPSFALTYVIYVLIVVSVGGLGSIAGTFAAAMLLGVSDMAGKYYIPALGSVLIYLVMLGMIMWRPTGLFGNADVTDATIAGPRDHLQAQIVWRWAEVAFWLATLLPFVLTPDYLVLASQIAIAGLFALSLDLILGFSGIISLGHAVYFGVGAYTAGLVSKWGWGEPLTGLLIAGAAAGLFGYATSFIIARFRHLALIMITLGLALLMQELANSAGWLTGGFDGLQGIQTWPILQKFDFDLYGYTAYSYALAVLFVIFLFARRLIHSPFGLALRGIRENLQRMPAIGAPVHSHIRTIYTIAAIIAGIAGALLAQTTETVSLETLGFQRSADVVVMLIIGGAGRLYGGLIGAIVYMVARDQFSGLNPQYWYFWIGLLLIAVVMLLPDGILGGLALLMQRLRSKP